MKTFLAVLLTAGVTFAAAQWFASHQQARHIKAAVAAARSQWDAEKAALQVTPTTAPALPLAIATTAKTEPTKATHLAPQEILDQLLGIKLGTGNERNRSIRRVVYYLESLRDCGPAALPVVRNFFALNQDIDYNTDDAGDAAATDGNGDNRRSLGGRGSSWSFRRGGELRTDFVLPPSLRLGLVDVVRSIGGPDAEAILAAALETSGRGIEVAYLAKSLEELAPGKYREIALTAAKDLLAHPMAIDRPNRLDNMSEGYLYDLLQMYGDTSFAATAQQMLIGINGYVNRNALEYLNTTLKEQAVPMLYQAYNNPALTNFFEKARIARDVLGYVGRNQTANQMLKDIVNNPDYDNRVRGFTIMQLSGGFGQDENVDAATYAARIPVVDQLLASTTDTQLVDTLNRTRANLMIRATNGVPESPWGRWGGGRGGRGGPPGGG